MFLNPMLCMVYLFSNMCKTGPVCSYLQLKLRLFLFDTMLDVSECMFKQILEIELSDFFYHQCQMSLILCRNKGIAFL